MVNYTLSGRTICLSQETTELLDESVDASIRCAAEREIKRDAETLAMALGRSVIVETSHGTTRSDLGAK